MTIYKNKQEINQYWYIEISHLTFFGFIIKIMPSQILIKYQPPLSMKARHDCCSSCLACLQAIFSQFILKLYSPIYSCITLQHTNSIVCFQTVFAGKCYQVLSAYSRNYNSNPFPACILLLPCLQLHPVISSNQHTLH